MFIIYYYSIMGNKTLFELLRPLYYSSEIRGRSQRACDFSLTAINLTERFQWFNIEATT